MSKHIQQIKIDKNGKGVPYFIGKTKKNIKELPEKAEFVREEFVDNENLIKFYADDDGNKYTELWKRVDVEVEENE